MLSAYLVFGAACRSERDFPDVTQDDVWTILVAFWVLLAWDDFDLPTLNLSAKKAMAVVPDLPEQKILSVEQFGKFAWLWVVGELVLKLREQIWINGSNNIGCRRRVVAVVGSEDVCEVEVGQSIVTVLLREVSCVSGHKMVVGTRLFFSFYGFCDISMRSASTIEFSER